jgi:hypothetical protein
MCSGSCLTSALYDKNLKMSSKSHETIPLKGSEKVVKCVHFISNAVHECCRLGMFYPGLGIRIREFVHPGTQTLYPSYCMSDPGY